MMLDNFGSLGLVDVNGNFDFMAADRWYRELKSFWHAVNIGSINEDEVSEAFGGSTGLASGGLLGESDITRRREILIKLRHIFNHRNDAGSSDALGRIISAMDGWQEWPIDKLQQLLTFCQMLSVDATMNRLFDQAEHELKRMEAIYQFSKEIEQQEQRTVKRRERALNRSLADARQKLEGKQFWLNEGAQTLLLFNYYYDSDSGHLKLHINPDSIDYDIKSQELVDSIKGLPIVNRCKISIDNYDQLSAQQGLTFGMAIFRAGHDLMEGDLYRYNIRQDNATQRNLDAIFRHRSELAGVADWMRPAALSRLVDAVLVRVPSYPSKITSIREFKNSYKQTELRSYGIDLGGLSMMFSDDICEQLLGGDDENALSKGRIRVVELLQLYQQRADRKVLLNKIADYLNLSLEIPSQLAMAEQVLQQFEQERKSNLKQYSSRECHFADIAVNSQVPLLHNAYRLRDMAKYALLSKERRLEWSRQLANYYSEPELQQFHRDFDSYQRHLSNGAKLWQQLQLKPDLDTLHRVQELSEKLDRCSLMPDLIEANDQRNLIKDLSQLGIALDGNLPVHAQLFDGTNKIKELLIYGNQEIQVRYSQSMRESFEEFYRVGIRKQQGLANLRELIASYGLSSMPQKNGVEYNELAAELRSIGYAMRHMMASEPLSQRYLQQLLASEGYSQELQAGLIKIAEDEGLIAVDLPVSDLGATFVMAGKR